MRLSRLAATLALGVLLTLAGTSCGSTRAPDAQKKSSPPVTSKPLTGVCKALFDFSYAPGATKRSPEETLAESEKLAPLIPPELEQAYADLGALLKAEGDGKGTKLSAEENNKAAAAFSVFSDYAKNTCGIG